MNEKMRQEAINKNFEAFKQILPTIIETHRGKFALLKDQEIIEFFDTAKDAFLAGKKLYNDDVFSVQEVTDTFADLGYYSHAMHQRPSDQ